MWPLKSGLWRKNCLGLNLGFIVSLSKLPICLSFLIRYLPHDVLRIKSIPVCKVLRITEWEQKSIWQIQAAVTIQLVRGTSLVEQWKTSRFHCRAAKFWSLIRELRSGKLCGMPKIIIIIQCNSNMSKIIFQNTKLFTNWIKSYKCNAKTLCQVGTVPPSLLRDVGNQCSLAGFLTPKPFYVTYSSSL